MSKRNRNRHLADTSPSPTPSPPPPFSTNPYQRRSFWGGPWSYWSQYRRPQVNYQTVARQIASQVRGLPRSGYPVGFVVGQILALRSIRRNDVIIAIPPANSTSWQSTWFSTNFQNGVRDGIRYIQDQYTQRGERPYFNTSAMQADSTLVWGALNS